MQPPLGGWTVWNDAAAPAEGKKRVSIGQSHSTAHRRHADAHRSGNVLKAHATGRKGLSFCNTLAAARGVLGAGHAPVLSSFPLLAFSVPSMLLVGADDGAQLPLFFTGQPEPLDKSDVREAVTRVDALAVELDGSSSSGHFHPRDD
jgi:hypothetical protein